MLETYKNCIMICTYRETVIPSDVDNVIQITESTKFFNDEEIAVAAELVNETLRKGDRASGYFFVFAQYENSTIGFVCYGPTPCTTGTFDLYWIVVDESYRGLGIGKQLLHKSEFNLQLLSARKLYIETSSTPRYEPTRKFYTNAGYIQEARLKDYYSKGDDKIIYSKYFY